MDEKCARCGGVLGTSMIIIPVIEGRTIKYDYTRRCTECRTRITVQTTYETPLFKDKVEG